MAKTTVSRPRRGRRGARRAVRHCHRAGRHSLGARSRHRLAAAAPRPERHAAALGRWFADPRRLLAQGTGDARLGRLGRTSSSRLLIGTIDVIRFRHRGTWRRAAGKSSMAALVAAVFVLASIRGSFGATAPRADSGRLDSGRGIPRHSDQRHTPSPRSSHLHRRALATASMTSRSTHYGDGEQWHAIYAANVGVRQPDGRALDGTNWIYPGWKLTLPDVATPATAPVIELADTTVPTANRPACQRPCGHYPCRRAWGQLVGHR